MTKAEAANKAINYCIENNVLAEFFAKRRNEVVGMILEYTAEQAEKDMAKLEREISEKEQRIEGLGQELSEKDRKIAENDEIIARLLEENARLKSAK